MNDCVLVNPPGLSTSSAVFGVLKTPGFNYNDVTKGIRGISGVGEGISGVGEGISRVSDGISGVSEGIFGVGEWVIARSLYK